MFSHRTVCKSPTPQPKWQTCISDFSRWRNVSSPSLPYPSFLSNARACSATGHTGPRKELFSLEVASIASAFQDKILDILQICSILMYCEAKPTRSQSLFWQTHSGRFSHVSCRCTEPKFCPDINILLSRHDLLSVFTEWCRDRLRLRDPWLASNSGQKPAANSHLYLSSQNKRCMMQDAV